MATLAREQRLRGIPPSLRFAPGPDSLRSRGAAVEHGSIGVILNGRAHRHLNEIVETGTVPGNVSFAAPSDPGELGETLAEFARHRIDTLVISGGDGTVRDVLSAMPPALSGRAPRMMIVPSGKTNALAGDLGMPDDLRLDQAIRLIGESRIERRSPLVIARDDGAASALRGFLLGAGGFVRATALAQETHRRGAFNGLAVGLTLVAAMAQSAFGGAENEWRRGEPMRLVLPDREVIDGNMYLLLASTLEHLPLGVRPFGRSRPGLKMLGVEAPPRSLALALASVLSGYDRPWLKRFGIRRATIDTMRLGLESGFILDGERYPGGALTITRGEPIEFLVPPKSC